MSNKKNWNDFIGKTFRFWKVIKHLGLRSNSQRHQIFQCECIVCGYIGNVSSHILLAGTTKRCLMCNRKRKRTRRSIADRFWSKVDRHDGGGCWIWKGGVVDGGYGMMLISIDEGARGAHRVSWELANGPIPEGLFVCHSCDVNYPVGDTSYRRCVRPDHLYLGTAKKNSEDMVAKGRSSFGSRCGTAKLTESQVVEILLLRGTGVKPKELAKKYGVGDDQITCIWRREQWKHVEIPGEQIKHAGSDSKHSDNQS